MANIKFLSHRKDNRRIWKERLENREIKKKKNERNNNIYCFYKQNFCETLCETTKEKRAL